MRRANEAKARRVSMVGDFNNGEMVCASMPCRRLLYRNYSRKPREWVPDAHGGPENLEAIATRYDTLRYVQKHPLFRRYHHHDITFGRACAFSENLVLPISHNEVVHGKGALLNKMPGDLPQKIANLRAYPGFIWIHSGKTLLFMGCRLGCKLGCKLGCELGQLTNGITTLPRSGIGSTACIIAAPKIRSATLTGAPGRR